FLTAHHVTAKPKIFGLLSGKLMIDQIEIDRPVARVVMSGGKLQNLKLDLPEAPKSDGPTKAPLSVISTNEAEVGLTIADGPPHGREIDADMTTDDVGAGGTAYEIAVRVGEVRTTLKRRVKASKGAADSTTEAFDDDTLCRIDGRARIEPKRILVRRF